MKYFKTIFRSGGKKGIFYGEVATSPEKLSDVRKIMCGGGAVEGTDHFVRML